MRRYYGLQVLVGVASLVTIGQCDLSCSGTDGRPGEAGIPGRDGWPGAKGEKGEPAATASGPVDPGLLLRLKGETGSRGEQGVMGPKGYRGEVGPAGRLGQPGLQGPDGRRLGNGGERSLQQARSAFSVMRTDHSYPAFSQVVTYQRTVVNTPGDFNAATGRFTCRVPGVYYFTFQSVARVSVCLRIASDPPFNKVGFCDYNRNTDQVCSSDENQAEPADAGVARATMHQPVHVDVHVCWSALCSQSLTTSQPITPAPTARSRSSSSLHNFPTEILKRDGVGAYPKFITEPHSKTNNQSS